MTTVTTGSLCLQHSRTPRARLAAAGVDSPRHDAEELAAHLLGVRPNGLRLIESIDAEAYEAAGRPS